MTAALVRVEDVASHIKTFWFRPARRVQYMAGQFTELYLPHRNPDDRGERRWFTLSSSPTEELLAITTRFSRGRNSTFKQTLRNVPIGTEVSLADPMGDFVLPKDKTIPLLFVAVGMGVTPVRSMVKYLLDTRERRRVKLLYAVPVEKQLAFRDIFTAYELGFMPLVREPSPEWHGEAGALASDRVLELLGDSLNAQVYLSGPEVLAEKLAADVKKHGVAGHRIVTDLFPGYNHG